MVVIICVKFKIIQDIFKYKFARNYTRSTLISHNHNHSGPFKKYVTQKIEILNPLPPCHTQSSFSLNPLPPCHTPNSDKLQAESRTLKESSGPILA